MEIKAFPVPEPFCWDESFSVGYKELDEEHQGLFKIVSEINNNRNSASLLKKCKELAISHFLCEEKRQQKANFAGYDLEKKVHDEFLEVLGKVSCPVTDEVVNFAKDWLVQHIKNYDMLYKGKL
ncbi:PREDICTED: hemerythrin-like isoform X2 [Priapulus caudatus]|uniref:Hemerythrin-like isoform X2 n=1 Tax=Priapulus caudatus TaxID=37621 RepID=A0ABM1DWJ2_PRICU|nr:PREDICTED: hemerythrin-like isoform X2 [Priapulus caudatus]